MESLGDFHNELLSTDNIMTSTRLPRYIKFLNNIDIAENAKRTLRKTFGLNFKGVKGKKAQDKLVMDYAMELRGTGKKFKNVRYAYRFLAEDYNVGVEQKREEITTARKVRKELEKRLIKFKLSKKGQLCINEDTLKTLGIESILRLIIEYLAGEMVLLYAKSIEIAGEELELNENEKFYTLTQGNLERLIEALSSVAIDSEKVVNESDLEYAQVLMETTELCIKFIDFVEDDLDANGNVKTKKGGAFFKYLNKTKFDLTRYGVYEAVNPDNYKHNCLYKAFENGGMGKDKLNLLTSFVVNRDIPISKLKAVCEKLHIQIKLRKNDKYNKPIIYGKGHTEEYEIGLVDRHYFLIEKCDFTMFAMKNYWELYNTDWEVDEIKYFYKKRGNSYSSDESRKTDSFKVMKFLIENKEEYLMPISFDKGILETQFVDRAFDFDSLNYDEEECCKENEYDVDKEDYKVARGKEWKKWYFDTESYKQKYKNLKIEKEIAECNDSKKRSELKKKLYSYIHIPYMACAISDKGEKIVAYGDGCCKLMLEYITKYTEERESGYETGEYNIQQGCMDKVCKKALLIAHNCNYDYRFFQKYLYCIDQKTKGSGLMNATARYMSYKQNKTEVRLQFKDSLKLIAMPLRKFGKCFGLKQEKEIFPYGLYRKNTLIENWVDVGSPIVTGSHTDTVPTAGKYDGSLGVLAGIEAAHQLRGQLSHPLEVVIFYDEENSMSGSLGYCAGSPPIHTFLELHVEQGPLLDVERKDIGIVKGIVGQRRNNFKVYGQENHAGTTPMNMRNDALVKTSEIITYINNEAMEYDGLVATVGELNVSPNSFSVIPGLVEFTLQVRDLNSDTMEEFVEKVCKKFDLRYDITHHSEPALCHQTAIETIGKACQNLRLSSVIMPSRASHDAQCFTWCPMGMIFVPSIGGVSHSPEEETTDEMCYNGLNVLTETIRMLDEKKSI